MRLLIFVLLLTIACQRESGGNPNASSGVIKIAVAGPLTGDQAKMGQDIMKGVELAVAEQNEKGGILGKKLLLSKEDDRHDPKEAVSVANKLVNQRVTAVIGHFNSSCSIPASSIYHDFGIVMITPASTNPQLTEQGLWNVFRVCGRDDQQGKVGADFVLQVLKKRRIAILHDKTTYGQGLADEFKRGVEKEAEVVAYEGIIQGDHDYSPVLTRVKARNPEIFYYGGMYPEAALLIRQMHELGLNIPFVSGDGVIDPEFLRIAGEAAEGTYLSFGPSIEDLPSAKHFLEVYRSQYGEPGPYSAYAYDATNIILKSMESCQCTDGRALSEAIRKIKYDGSIGHLEFDAKGDVLVAPYIFWIVKGGKFIPYQEPL